MEKFVIKKRASGKFRIALIYPNTYRVAMANLGFRLLYFLLNQRREIFCERFTSDSNLSIESGSRLKDFDLLAFCYQYENDLLRIIELIEKEKLWDKPKLFGGPCTTNPFPIRPFADLVYVGEAEASLEELVEAILRGAEREELARIRGVYVTEIDNEVRRAYPSVLPKLPPFQVSSEDTAFGDAFLLEMSRGCVWNCKFCMGRSIFAPYRERKLDDLLETIEIAMRKGKYKKLVLIAASIGNYSRLEEFCRELRKLVTKFGFVVSAPSVRVDALNEDLLRLIVESGERTIALAPESSERLRCWLGKVFDDQSVIDASKLAKRVGIKQIKLYLMFGLPGETEKDLIEAARLVNEVKRIGVRVTVSANPFVPKPHTPLEREQFVELKELKRRFALLRREIKTKVITEGLRDALLQALIARGDEIVGRMLLHAYRSYGRLDLRTVKGAAKQLGIELSDYLGERKGKLPWHRVKLL